MDATYKRKSLVMKHKTHKHSKRSYFLFLKSTDSCLFSGPGSTLFSLVIRQKLKTRKPEFLRRVVE